MFTLDQINQAHSKVKSGADFPKYIQEIKKLGVKSFETWVTDSHTRYHGENNFQLTSEPKYEKLLISETTHKKSFLKQLKEHQSGKTDYFQFCNDCATTGIEKWIVDLNELTCKYFDKNGNEVLTEIIPSS